jgi:hypothetical protein
MNNNDIILNELKEISPAVANLNRRNIYTVPSGYFLGLAERILTHVKLNSENSTLSASELPFKVPQNYFEGLSNEILSKVRQQNTTRSEVEMELAEIAPLLNTISKTPVYTVPQGYFDNLKIRKDEGKARVVTMSRTNRIIKYAAAATITGLVALGGLFYANNDKNDGSITADTQFNQQQVKQLSDEEIVNYLDKNSVATDITQTNNNEEKQLIQYTKELTDEEILDYLKDNGESVETDSKEG